MPVALRLRPYSLFSPSFCAVADAAAICQAIIWMHGLGDQGESWRSLQADFKAIGVPVKWQFPDAPVAAVTCNDGYKMRSWFDIEEIPVAQGARDYADDISASMERIHAMIATLEEEGYGAREIVVGAQLGAQAPARVLEQTRVLEELVMQLRHLVAAARVCTVTRF